MGPREDGNGRVREGGTTENGNETHGEERRNRRTRMGRRRGKRMRSWEGKGLVLPGEENTQLYTYVSSIDKLLIYTHRPLVPLPVCEEL